VEEEEILDETREEGVDPMDVDTIIEITATTAEKKAIGPECVHTHRGATFVETRGICPGSAMNLQT
jgi:hypothetical protein